MWMHQKAGLIYSMFLGGRQADTVAPSSISPHLKMIRLNVQRIKMKIRSIVCLQFLSERKAQPPETDLAVPLSTTHIQHPVFDLGLWFECVGV